MSESKIIVALDMESKDKALACLKLLDPNKVNVKIGKEMFTGCGPDWVKAVINMGFNVFLDLKYHDIPNTVYKACLRAAELGVWMVNVHALGGKDMLQKAHEAVMSFPKDKRPLLIGVTILTSMSDEDIHAVGLLGSVSDNVKRLSKLCFDAGLDGVVCSAQEAKDIKASLGLSQDSKRFLCVTPGIRFESDNLDQKRVMGPKEALQNGADYLVIGRSITEANNPAAVVEAILNAI